jgi:hypothetical protein
MKKLVILLVLAVAISSCAKKDRAREPEDDFLKVYSTPEQTTTPISTYTPSYQATSMNTTPTYWYVTFEELKKNEKGEVTESTDCHKAIKLNTPYFDFIEARKWLDVNANIKGECYFDFILQINKESFDSYMVYRVEYFKD